ncbi:hypothetical protein ACFOVU_17895 [Nocardiopsis sediminis]|uniref:Uncharacterized protein n=1 Tax=Nocardiopsis sediminis TaxID=1778267 RepID=A0ABV8FS36_9ACTN
MGRVRYGLLWLDHHAARLGLRVRPVGDAFAGAASEIRWVARLTAASAAARLDRTRPEPWTDRRLLAAALIIALGALAVSSLLGFALSRWMATRPGDVLPAAGGAVVVAAVLCALAYLVFASKPRRTPTRKG